jgi:hypothetical protein
VDEQEHSRRERRVRDFEADAGEAFGESIPSAVDPLRIIVEWVD